MLEPLEVGYAGRAEDDELAIEREPPPRYSLKEGSHDLGERLGQRLAQPSAMSPLSQQHRHSGRRLNLRGSVDDPPQPLAKWSNPR
jgi:hypothetical protein